MLTHAAQTHTLNPRLEHASHTSLRARAGAHLKNSPVTDVPQLVLRSWRAAGGAGYRNIFALRATGAAGGLDK